MNADEKLDRLESWAVMAAAELQDFCDEAQISAGNPDGEDQLQGVRQLLAELDEIIMPDWMNIIIDDSAGLPGESIAVLENADIPGK